ncbi:mandelate racemase/muconate lactonizing enzyme family protein [Aliamphritea hakodatensis]|uniref:mandelate racemase/muconate lactonizing enzyme family protein n=1 Tax=Aliamphritea hakodatensis TaxID=2895352 RepID=UPI0022FDA066|nr:mandelate racemase/muconate lactonizing enzyme family protein [Aliamphritea hakodatensis]
MKICQIDVWQKDLPIQGPAYKMALQTLTALDTTLVRITTDNGIEGWGEVCPLGPAYQPQHAAGARAAIGEIAPHLLGENPQYTEQINQRMHQALCGSLYAKSAIDMACWDISGKAYNSRVCDLLGGAVREVIPSYYAIGLSSPEEAASVAVKKQAEGFRRLQLKVGGRTLDEDIACVSKVAEVLTPGTELAVDANRGLNVNDAIQLSAACRDIRFVFEQPCQTYEQCLHLRGNLHHPLWLDEVIEDLNGLLRAIGDNAAQGFGMKQSRIGGISLMRTAREICAVAGLPMTCDDSWGGDLVAASCVHLGATVTGNLFAGSWIAAPYIDGHYDNQNPVALHNGQLRVPEGAGLGVTPDGTRLGSPAMSFSL